MSGCLPGVAVNVSPVKVKADVDIDLSTTTIVGIAIGVGTPVIGSIVGLLVYFYCKKKSTIEKVASVNEYKPYQVNI